MAETSKIEKLNCSAEFTFKTTKINGGPARYTVRRFEVNSDVIVQIHKLTIFSQDSIDKLKTENTSVKVIRKFFDKYYCETHFVIKPESLLKIAAGILQIEDYIKNYEPKHKT